MLLQLHDTNKKEMLLQYARENSIVLTIIDNDSNANYLPGAPLTNDELESMIIEGRKKGMISMQDAHALIRKSYNAD
jgi:hypothetical protein